MPSSLYLLGSAHVALLRANRPPRRPGLLLIGAALFVLGSITAHLVLAVIIGLHIAIEFWKGLSHRSPTAPPEGTVAHILPGRSS